MRKAAMANRKTPYDPQGTKKKGKGGGNTKAKKSMARTHSKAHPARIPQPGEPTTPG